MMRARFWTILLAVSLLLLVTVVLVALVPFDLSNVRVQQGLIAGIVVALGWIAGFALRELSAHMGRAERLRDVHRALFAEIRHNLGNLGAADDLRVYGEDKLTEILGTDGYVPFIPREKNDTVFSSVVADIHILPRITIDPIVQYYSQLAAADALAEDMRGEGYRAMSPRARGALYADYIGLKMNLVDYGIEATEVIDAYANRSRREARQISGDHRRRRARGTPPRAGAAASGKPNA